MAVLKKWDLVNFMITKHRKEYGKEISPIKLQKGLYFLYAFWGGKIRSQQLVSDDSSEDDITEMTEMETSYDENLFEANFEAWAYGPVDREVYVWFKELTDDEKIGINQESLSTDEDVSWYLNDLLTRIYNSNDFGLVDLSHEDKCWRDVFNPSFKMKMNNDDILQEYATHQ